MSTVSNTLSIEVFGFCVILGCTNVQSYGVGYAAFRCARFLDSGDKGRRNFCSSCAVDKGKMASNADPSAEFVSLH